MLPTWPRFFFAPGVFLFSMSFTGETAIDIAYAKDFNNVRTMLRATVKPV